MSGLVAKITKNYFDRKKGKDVVPMLSAYPEQLDFNSLSKIAIDYSDGVIEAGTNVDQSLLEYAEGKGIPLLRYPGEDYKAAYKEFFDGICGEE